MNIHISKDLYLWFGLLLFGITGFFLTVLFPQSLQGFYAFVVVAALGGFGVAFYIYYTKTRGKHLVCPSGGDCNAVVTSKYSKFFGIPIEYMGMGYFGVVFIAYLTTIAAPHLFDETLRFALTVLSSMAFLFSGYLLFVQAFLLRKWCIWCVLAAMFSMTIFLISLSNMREAVLLLEATAPVFTLLKFLGFVLGMGGATATAFLFTKFLRDFDVDEKELNIIKDISELIWIGLGLSVISQLALYVANPAELMGSPVFLIQMIALFGAAFAGAILMVIYAPFLAYVPFSKGEKHASFTSLRRPTLVFGALALSSWYFAFAVNYSSGYSFQMLSLWYAAMLGAAVCSVLMWEQYILQRGKKKA